LKKKIEYLTPKQFRSRFIMSISQVYILLNDPVDPLPHYRFGASYRIISSELDDWLERHIKIKRKMKIPNK